MGPKFLSVQKALTIKVKMKWKVNRNYWQLKYNIKDLFIDVGLISQVFCFAFKNFYNSWLF